MIPRRDFLLTSLAATAAAAMPLRGRVSAESPSPLIDTNVWLGRWPIRDLPLAEQPAALAAKLKANGVTSAWACSLDAVLHKDIHAVNQKLAETCHAFPLFEPFGAVNLSLPKWDADIAFCAALKMRGIRLLPAYHGYGLDDPRVVEALKAATELKLPVQITFLMEDVRTQNPLLTVKQPDLAALLPSLQAAPGARIMLLSWLQGMSGLPVLRQFKDTSAIFDIALLEGIAGIEAALTELPLEKLCFGSYAPVFYHEAAKLKLQESELTAAQMTAITHGNALRFLSA